MKKKKEREKTEIQFQNKMLTLTHSEKDPRFRMQGTDSLPVFPLYHLPSLKNGINGTGKNPHFFPFVPWLRSSVALVTLVGGVPFRLAQDSQRMPPLMLPNRDPASGSAQSWRILCGLGTPVAPRLCGLALDHSDYGCRTQQLRIHEKENWKEVSDTNQGVLMSQLLQGPRLVSNWLWGAVTVTRVH